MNSRDVLEVPHNFEFPFTPYNIQHEFMSKLYEVIENKQLGVFESPTGTGKSLSLVCGAVRWLKDHNESIRNHLQRKLSTLQEEKRKVSNESSDWLSCQAKEIEITRKLHELKIEQDKISEYDKKIANLKDLNKEKVALKRWKANKKLNTNEKVLEEALSEEDDNILLEEPSEEEIDKNDEDESQKFQPVKIYICSRTHSQLSQFIGEITKSPFGKDLRVVSLASRQNYCINPRVQSLKSMTLMNESCLDMQKQRGKQSSEDGKVVKRQKTTNCSCIYKQQQQIDDLKDWTLIQIQDIEDLVNSGKELQACPYYASRKAAEDAEIVLIPYNTLLHKATREANGIDIKNNVVIIDEAHNLLEALTQMYSTEINYRQIEQSLKQLELYKKRYATRFSAFNLLSINQLIFVVKKLKQLIETKAKSSGMFTTEDFVLTAEIDNYNMFKLVEFCKNSRIAHKIRSYAIQHPVEPVEIKPKKGIKEFLSSIQNKQVPAEKEETIVSEPIKPPTNVFLPIISFLESLTYSYKDGRILIQKTENFDDCKLKFLLLNPSSAFNDIVKDARSIIVAGGTMKPINEFKERLFLNAGADINRVVVFSCDHIIPKENILPIIVTKGVKNESLRFNYENRLSMGPSIKNIILECCKTIPGGIVIFFPSYKYESWVWEQVKNEKFGREVFREPQTSNLIDSVLEKYAKAIKKPQSKGALLFSVVGGKLSEGLNFSDDLGRCVVVIGMPYANIQGIELKEKMSHLNKTEGAGAGQTFYENLCYKAVNQCIGRAVRHKNDYATVLLVDERYNRIGTKNSLPDWIKRSLQVANFQETFTQITKFFQRKKTENHS